ncbi:uncharacterized protein [Rutidosis leptorrhynchoides]|uniref:uncharacterized protein n=1 Tax=Rutidosis leptorrhynchoides TaxID=125765 RepID=UPI003A98DA7B
MICIHGTHLKGSYKGKLLIAVGKNANNQIIPIAFALIDEESNESWVWFLQMLQENVIGNEKLFVISDRYPGKWTVYRDRQRSRWGNTTTNIAESLNNVFRHARMMSIKACIEYTFDYTRQHFYDQSRDARLCNSPLSKNMFNVFNEWAKRAQRYKTTCYHEQQGIFKVHSTYQRSGEGGTDYTVEFKEKRCSCGIWQHQRLPCSHTISVCSHLNEDINKCISKMYTTPTWRKQYIDHFNPLRYASYWTHIQWKIKADPSRLIKHRGRKQSKRMKNQMDEREKQKPKCGICRVEGHNRTTCPTTRMP